MTSREFKKPSAKFLASKTLYIQPFSEEKVYDLLNKHLNEVHVKSIFGNPLLRTLSRNPFSASLIIEYILTRKEVPKSQFALYKICIVGRLNEHDFTDSNLSAEKCWKLLQRLQV